MIIAIGADHGGYDLKEGIKRYLEENGHKIIDCGTNSRESVDYPDLGLKVAEKVRQRKAERGILVCTTGIGQSIVANKIPGIRAAFCLETDQAELSRRHNDANIIVFGAKYTGEDKARKMVNVFIKTEFEAGRHKRRVEKIKEIEQKYCK
jgi:ribose 5-phosphate isomerase B